jgi:ATP-dependent DNA helicase DinG
MAVVPPEPTALATAALAKAVAALPRGGEARPGQVEMAEAVARAVDGKAHLVVQAGTGTGKSLGYLVPAVLAGKRTVVATATKNLQDQLVGRDLPFLADALEGSFTFAGLKGRSNYFCRQRATEVVRAASQGTLDAEGLDDSVHEEVLRLIAWGAETDDGDRSGLDFEPSGRAWGAVSVSAAECPGASRCPMGEVCFAEQARARGADVDVLVVNTHLYGTHLAAGRGVLPEHDVVVFDEAHQLEEILSATAGLELGGGRFTAVARSARAILAEPGITDQVEGAGVALVAALSDFNGQRVAPAQVAKALGTARSRLGSLSAALGSIKSTDADATTRKARAQAALTGLLDDIDRVLELGTGDVAWVEGPPGNPVLKVAPVDVSATLAGLLEDSSVVLTSATIPAGLGERLGMPAARTTTLDVGSPFDYEAHSILYCALHLPDPRALGYAEAVADELVALIEAAGGRTLALFTSWRAMQAALEAVRGRVTTPVLAQGELPKPALIDAFTDDESASLFATMGFWQGIDVPGRTLSCVVVDRLPFPRPDDPLLQARRELVGRQKAFGLVDLPRAATLLAQGAGRLIRTADDRGVVAVLDSRLGKAGYRWDIIRALPPMRRTRDRAEVEQFLRDIATTAESEPAHLAPDDA